MNYQFLVNDGINDGAIDGLKLGLIDGTIFGVNDGSPGTNLFHVVFDNNSVNDSGINKLSVPSFEL